MTLTILSQNQRVLALAKRRGRHGITATDFLLPDVADGGPPITRLAARIKDLQDDGIRFRDGGRRSKVKVYVLDDSSLPAVASSPPSPVSLLPQVAQETAPPRCAIFDYEDVV